MDLIIIFLAKNGKLFLDHTDPLNLKYNYGNGFISNPTEVLAVWFQHICKVNHAFKLIFPVYSRCNKYTDMSFAPKLTFCGDLPPITAR